MAFHVMNSRNANRDISEIVEWLSDQDADWADAWLTRLAAVREDLALNPARHPVAEEFDSTPHPVRILQFGKKRNVYCLFYTVVGDTITVLRIRHAARDSLSEDDL